MNLRVWTYWNSLWAILLAPALIGLGACQNYNHDDWQYDGFAEMPAVQVSGLSIALINGLDRRPDNLVEHPESMDMVMHDIRQMILHGVADDMERSSVAKRVVIDPASLLVYDYVFMLQLFSPDNRNVDIQLDAFSSLDGPALHAPPIRIGHVGGDKFGSGHYPKLRQGISKTTLAILDFLSREHASLQTDQLAQAARTRKVQFYKLQDPGLLRMRKELQLNASNHNAQAKQFMVTLAGEIRTREEMLEILRLIELEHAEKVTEAMQNYFWELTTSIDAGRESYLATKKAEQQAKGAAAFAGVMAVASAAAQGYGDSQGMDTASLGTVSTQFTDLMETSLEEARQLSAQAVKVAQAVKITISTNYPNLDKYPEFRDLKGSIFEVRSGFFDLYRRRNRSIEDLLFRSKFKEHPKYPAVPPPPPPIELEYLDPRGPDTISA